MIPTERTFHYYNITICFPAAFFSFIVLYLFFKDRFKHR
jgi:hypothetical protein